MKRISHASQSRTSLLWILSCLRKAFRARATAHVHDRTRNAPEKMNPRRFERWLRDPSGKLLRVLNEMTDISIRWLPTTKRRGEAACEAARGDKNNRYVIRPNYIHGACFYIARRSDFNDGVVEVHPRTCRTMTMTRTIVERPRRNARWIVRLNRLQCLSPTNTDGNWR